MSSIRSTVPRTPGIANRSFGIGTIGGMSPHQAVPLARQWAEKALAIDETLSEAHSVLGSVKFQYDWDWDAAAAAYQRALALSPTDPIAHRSYGWFLAARGRLDDGIRELTRARDLDPTSILTAENLGVVLHFAGRNDELPAEAAAAGGGRWLVSGRGDVDSSARRSLDRGHREIAAPPEPSVPERDDALRDRRKHRQPDARRRQHVRQAGVRDVTLSADGVEYPVPQVPGFVSVCRWVGTHALETMGKKDGAIVGHRTYAVSDDGQTMTAPVKGGMDSTACCPA